MQKLLTILFAITLVAVIAGCQSTTALTEMARIQGQQATQMDKITKLIEQQNQDIATLRKQAEATAVRRAELNKIIKARLSATEKSSQDKMLQAALLLAKKGSRNVSGRAITILGSLGGAKAEVALLTMIDSPVYRNNYSTIMAALVALHSDKLRQTVIKLLERGNSDDINAVMSVIQNRSIKVLKQIDLPILEKLLNEFPNNNFGNNTYQRRNILKAICLLDQDKGIDIICEELGIANKNQQRELLYIPIHGGFNLTFKSWQKIVKIIGEPSSQNLELFSPICDGMTRSDDWRLTDIILPWATFAAQNSSFLYNYMNLLNRMRDPKAAKVILELSAKKKQQSRYLNNFPGIIKKGDKYQLVDAATMKLLLENRAKRIAHLNTRDKKRSAQK
jgi:hypothetical protein